jgi:hypothetical protein
VSTWDGAVKWSIEAEQGSTIGLVTVWRESEQSNYRDCRTMTLQPAEGAALELEPSYSTELEIETGDSIETFRVPVTPEQLETFATGAAPTFLLCDDPFALSPQQVERVAEFVVAWRSMPQ